MLHPHCQQPEPQLHHVAYKQVPQKVSKDTAIVKKKPLTVADKGRKAGDGKQKAEVGGPKTADSLKALEGLCDTPAQRFPSGSRLPEPNPQGFGLFPRRGF